MGKLNDAVRAKCTIEPAPSDPAKEILVLENVTAPAPPAGASWPPVIPRLELDLAAFLAKFDKGQVPLNTGTVKAADPDNALGHYFILEDLERRGVYPPA